MTWGSSDAGRVPIRPAVVGRVYPGGFAPNNPAGPRGDLGWRSWWARGGWRARYALLAGLLVALAGAGPADASGVYRWVDSRGVVHYTNVAPDQRYAPVEVFQPRRRPQRRPPGPVHTYDPLIRNAARRQGIPPALVKAVIHAESAFDPYAVSRAGAQGLMQLMPATANELGVSQPFGVTDNIYGGSRYLRMMHDRYGSWTLALAAYNAGPTAVDRYRGVPPYKETREYVRRVLTYYRRYHVDFPR